MQKYITSNEDLLPLEPSLTHPHTCIPRNKRQVAAEQHQGGYRPVAETGGFERGGGEGHWVRHRVVHRGFSIKVIRRRKQCPT